MNVDYAFLVMLFIVWLLWNLHSLCKFDFETHFIHDIFLILLQVTVYTGSSFDKIKENQSLHFFFNAKEINNIMSNNFLSIYFSKKTMIFSNCTWKLR